MIPLDPMLFMVVMGLLVLIGVFCVYMNDKIEEAERQRKDLEKRILKQLCSKDT